MIKLDLNEWDFRGLTDLNVGAAALYELTRSHKDLRNDLISKGKQPSRGEPKKGKLPDSAPTSNVPLTREEFDSNELFAAVIGQTRGPGAYIAAYFPEFSAPFLSLPKKRIEKPRCPAIFMVGEGEPFQVYPLNGAPKHAQAFTVNYGQSEAAVLAAFKAWLLAEGGFFDKRKQHRSPTYATLKALAAYRLDQNGVRYKEAKLAVEEMKRGGRDENDVLPWFEQHGGWTTAIKKTNKLLKELHLWMPARVEKRSSFKELSYLRTNRSNRQ